VADVSRGTATTLGYVLNLGVATILVTVLLLSAGTLVEDQRDRAADSELDVVAAQLASELAATDRPARASDGGTVRLDARAPRRVAGSTYEVRVNTSGNDRLVFVTDRLGTNVSVPYDTTLAVEPTIVGGGDLVVVYDAANATLEVRDA
jgi:hypothetical protein